VRWLITALTQPDESDSTMAAACKHDGQAQDYTMHAMMNVDSPQRDEDKWFERN